MNEVFGASSVIVRCADEAEMFEVAEHLEGQLTATLHLTAQDEHSPRACCPFWSAKPAGDRQWLADRRRGRARDGPWRPVPGDLGRPQHLRWHAGDRAVPAAGLLPGLPDALLPRHCVATPCIRCRIGSTAPIVKVARATNMSLRLVQLRSADGAASSLPPTMMAMLADRRSREPYELARRQSSATHAGSGWRGGAHPPSASIWLGRSVEQRILAPIDHPDSRTCISRAPA